MSFVTFVVIFPTPTLDKQNHCLPLVYLKYKPIISFLVSVPPCQRPWLKAVWNLVLDTNPKRKRRTTLHPRLRFGLV
jgi:hypothetical protein